jgi:predicted  nucleic acid-binding Zn-ribbon protein
MKLAILKIVLWPKQAQLPPRVIPFLADKINVITGESATGKSSLTAIIDYCLGSGKCAIPVGLIRDVSEWFGLQIKLANTELIVARRNPGDQQTTTDLYWIEGVNLQVPNRVEKNGRVEDLKSRLDQAAQLPHLELSADDSIGYGGRPSFRDMAAFNFQPQHIVANPYTLFFKADTTEHREKLRAMFPLVLGAVDSSTLEKQREFKDLAKEHDKLRRELDARLDAAKAWEAEVESYYLQAKALGLLPNSPNPDASWKLDRYVLELRPVPEDIKRHDIPEIKEGTSEEAVAQLTQILGEEDRLARQIGSVRQRLSKLDQLAASVGEYGVTLSDQKDRMLGVGWLERKLQAAHTCPVCSAVHEGGNEHLGELQRLAHELSVLSNSVAQAPAKLDQELAELRTELRSLEQDISKTRKKRQFLESQSQEMSAQRQRVRQIYLFVGRVEQALENLSASRNVGDLKERVDQLFRRIQDLRNELDPRAQRERERAAIESVSSRIHDHARDLQLEHAAENVRLNIRELTLQFTTLSGRTDFLWEVGSGQNWVGYHISCLLALHEHFFGLPNSPVPRFLVIDQPSQVYFPEAWPTLNETPGGKSADIEGVHRIFSALSKFLESLPEPFQIIVSEHAGAITWQGLRNVNVVANWREGQGDYLIPASWLKDV